MGRSNPTGDDPKQFKEMNKLNLVAFLILMEGGQGVAGKSEDYIMEKFMRYVMSNDDEAYLYGLDGMNQRKLEVWRMKWDKEYKHLKDLQK